MIQSKAWNWDVSNSPYWQEAASEVYPLIYRWKNQNLKKFLDLGCGVGRHALLFAANGFDVTAVDLSTDGIAKLNESAINANLKIASTIADMINLPYSNNSFDCLIAYHAIYHTDDEGIKKVISEIKRVLTKNGEAFITFNSQKTSSFSDPNNKQLSLNTIIKTQGNEAGIPHYYATKENIEQLLSDFEIINFNHKEEYLQNEYLGNTDYISAHFNVLVKKK